MTPSPELEHEQAKEIVAVRRYEIAKIVFALYFALASLFLIVQGIVVSNDIKNDNAKQHEKTQQYIRCIAETLTKPIAERQNGVTIDDCTARANGSTADDRADAGGTVQNSQQGTDNQSSTGITQSPPVTQTEETTPEQVRDIPPRSEPPDDEKGVITGIPSALDILLHPLSKIGL